MSRGAAAAALLGATLVGSGCAGIVGAPVVPPPAFVYTNFQAPLGVNMDETKVGSKRGVSQVVNILGLVSTGDASLASAAQAGDITTVRHVDYEFMSVLGVYSRYTTIVYGD